MSADNSVTIKFEADEWTADRVSQLAIEFGLTQDEVLDRCCRFGLYDYEEALAEFTR